MSDGRLAIGGRSVRGRSIGGRKLGGRSLGARGTGAKGGAPGVGGSPSSGGLDTALKRAAAMNIRLPWRRVIPFPDGTIDASDRAVMAKMYLLAGAAPAGASLDFSVNTNSQYVALIF